MDPPADDMGGPPVVGTSTASGTNIRNAIKQYAFEIYIIVIQSCVTL